MINLSPSTTHTLNINTLLSLVAGIKHSNESQTIEQYKQSKLRSKVDYQRNLKDNLKYNLDLLKYKL